MRSGVYSLNGHTDGVDSCTGREEDLATLKRLSQCLRIDSPFGYGSTSPFPNQDIRQVNGRHS